MSCLTPLFHRKLASGGKGMKDLNRPKSLPLKQKGTKKTPAGISSGVAGNSTLMMELRRKIVTFRDIIDLPTCTASSPINQLLMGLMVDLQKLYPEIVHRKQLSEMKGVPTEKVLASFCKALKAIGDSWMKNHDRPDKLRYDLPSFKENDNWEQQVEFVLATLAFLIKMARDRFDMEEEDEQDGDCSRVNSFGRFLSDADSESYTSSCSSPVTPSSVLPDSIDSCSPKSQRRSSPCSKSPQLWTLRVQAVGKFNPIDVKNLSIHLSTNGASDKKKKLVDEPSTGTEVENSPEKSIVASEEENSCNIAGEEDTAEVRNPSLNENSRKGTDDSRDYEDVGIRTTHPEALAADATEVLLPHQPSPHTSSPNLARPIPVPPPFSPFTLQPKATGASPLPLPPTPPVQPLSPKSQPTVGEPTLTSSNVAPARLPPPPPPPPPMTPRSTVAGPPTPPPTPRANGCAPPPPPPPMAPGSTVAAPPTPPPTPRANGCAPPPPPPPMLLANGCAPPPPPPPMRLANGAAPPAPPPMRHANGAAAPPPPPAFGGRSLQVKSTTKLKRSSQMGSLYRTLKGKVEGSSLNGKSSNGRKGGAGSSAGGGKGMADALAEMTKRSAYFQQIEEDVQKYSKVITEIRTTLSSFQTKDMNELLEFHKKVESVLEHLTDETQVLSRFEGFPTTKLETMRTAVALHSRLTAMITELHKWKIEAPLGPLLDKTERYFTKIKGEIDKLERTKDEETKKFQSQNIHFDFNILIRVKEAIVDVSSGCMELALKERREANANEQTQATAAKTAQKQSKGSAKMMWRAFQFAFRVYTFAGGHDDRADMLTRELATEIESDPHH